MLASGEVIFLSIPMCKTILLSPHVLNAWSPLRETDCIPVSPVSPVVC